MHESLLQTESIKMSFAYQPSFIGFVMRLRIGKVQEYLALIKSNEYDDVDIHDSIMEYIRNVIAHCKKDVLNFMKISKTFQDNSNINTYWSLNVILSLALRKIAIKDIQGLEWCSHEVIKSIGAMPIF